MKTKITLTNTFHSASVNLVVEPDRHGDYQLSETQTRRAIRGLCGIAECHCGGLGFWDPDYEVLALEDRYTGRIVGATVTPREYPNLRCS